MEFQEAKIEDVINGILEVVKASFSEVYSKEEIFKRLEGKKYWIYVAKTGENIVGFKIWYELNPNKIYSWLGAVHPNYRRKSIATKLMKIQFDLSKNLGYKIVEVKTHKGHPEMLNLLKKEGFKETKRDPDHWGNGKEAIFFEREVGH